MTDRQTHRPSTVTHAAHACRGLIRGVGTKHKVQGVAEGKTRDAPDGVKKVWGTMRGCSYKTLQRLTTVAENVEVHMKFKKRGNTEV